jgi:hypothetical protein
MGWARGTKIVSFEVGDRERNMSMLEGQAKRTTSPLYGLPGCGIPVLGSKDARGKFTPLHQDSYSAEL